MAGKVEIKSLSELEVMHTGTLMKRRAALLACEENHLRHQIVMGMEANHRQT